MFRCSQCGKCCEKVYTSKLYSFLADDTGKCKYLKDNKCSIYNRRTLICRVDAMYEHYYKDSMTLKEFYELNYQACKFLKNEKGS